MPLTPRSPDRHRVGVIRPSTRAALLGRRLLQGVRLLSHRPLTSLWTYLLLAAIGELLTARFGSHVGLVIQALLIAALGYRVFREPPGPCRDLILCIGLVPSARLLILAQILAKLAPIDWYLDIACVLMVLAGLVIWQVRIPYEELGWGPMVASFPAVRFRAPSFQLLLGAGGLGLGLLEAHFVPAAPLPKISGFAGFITSAAVIIVLSGFVGELIFRGLILNSALSVMRGWGLAYTTLLFVAMRVGHRPIADLLVAGVAGLLFAYVARSTHSLLGVSLAQGLATTVVLVIAPALASSSPGSLLTSGDGCALVERPGRRRDVRNAGVAWHDSAGDSHQRAPADSGSRVPRRLQSTSARPGSPGPDAGDPSRSGRRLAHVEQRRVRRGNRVEPIAPRRGDSSLAARGRISTNHSVRGRNNGSTDPKHPGKPAGDVCRDPRSSLAARTASAAAPGPRPGHLRDALRRRERVLGDPLVEGPASRALTRSSNGATKAPAPLTLHRIFNRIDVDAFENAVRSVGTRQPGRG